VFAQAILAAMLGAMHGNPLKKKPGTDLRVHTGRPITLSLFAADRYPSAALLGDKLIRVGNVLQDGEGVPGGREKVS
jgi:hypothetical protein